ncbi:4-hydroxy-2-oxovalerate aldolase [Kribbella sp. NBC_00709]|uniref:4-hydroxy-2-oxovalerate aldolase n=1 Tax=Kribbella sp. NBC_00709 TaxID=2975972 RepID=UPI002E2A1CC0|nr:4-hydroxy-2-oxovalerate aldolase [Kribbella sp. NBC_00709]
MTGMALHLVDTSLRDGMSSVSHQFTTDQVSAIAGGLARAGVRTIEVAHGVGIGGSSLQYGRAAATDKEYVEAAVRAAPAASIAALYVPGISTFADLDDIEQAGATTLRVAVHCTEADCAEQAVKRARQDGLTAMCFLMMSHKIEPAELARQASKLESYGAQVVYVVDSAGALVPTQAAARVAALRGALDIPVGFHAHNNLGLAIGNSLAAADNGATYIDGSLRGLGASAGNAQTEVLAVALDRSGFQLDVDAFALAEQVVAACMKAPQIIDEAALLIGYAGVYSTFFHPTKRAAAKYGTPVRDILLELGRRNIIGGQEDMIIDVAAELAGRREASR